MKAGLISGYYGCEHDHYFGHELADQDLGPVHTGDFCC